MLRHIKKYEEVLSKIRGLSRSYVITKAVITKNTRKPNLIEMTIYL